MSAKSTTYSLSPTAATGNNSPSVGASSAHTGGLSTSGAEVVKSMKYPRAAGQSAGS